MSISSANCKEIVLCDLDREFGVTRRVLERVPEEQFGFKPHEKSMAFGVLAMHVATMSQWLLDTIVKDELDLATAKGPETDPRSKDHLLATFDRLSAAVKEAVGKMDEAALAKTWTVRQGPQVLYQNSRAFILHVWCINHMVHHRAQLCVYLRLLNIPVPVVYFNSADEKEWAFG